MSVEVVGHPEQQLLLDLPSVPEEVWVRVAIERVFGQSV